MKALSIRQPWAWLIVRPDITDQAQRAQMCRDRIIKDIENRDWWTSVRGTVLVHAGKGMTRDEYEDAGDTYAIVTRCCDALPPFEQLERGGIVGKVDITGCVKESTSRWFFGKYGFQLANAQPLPFRPYRGQLGFFEVEP